MTDADQLREIADRLDAQEELTDYVQELEVQCRELLREVDYLNELLTMAGINPRHSFISVGQMMDITNALRHIT